MKKHTYTIDNYFDKSDLVFWAFRYMLGRQSYAVSDFAERLALSWNSLDKQVQQLIKKELDKAFLKDDETRALKCDYKTLGGDCDRNSWQKVKDAYEKAN
jgi:hypothetical protein